MRSPANMTPEQLIIMIEVSLEGHEDLWDKVKPYVEELEKRAKQKPDQPYRPPRARDAGRTGAR